MISSKVFQYTLSHGEHLNVQAVRADSFAELDFLRPDFDPLSFDKLCDLYRDYTIPRFPWIFGTLVHFYLPKDVKPVLKKEDDRYGNILDDTIIANVMFKEHAFLKDGEIVFDDEETERLFETLKERRCLRIARGKKKKLYFLPVGKNFGFLSQNKTDARLRVNANFFIMDLFDLGSVYDEVSTPFGLCVKNGKILFPPLFDREVLCVKDGKAEICHIALKDIEVTIDGLSYRDGYNARFYARPECRHTDEDGFDIVIVNDRVIACKKGGNCEIPSSGFVIHLDDEIPIKEGKVSYRGLDEIDFAIQVGNSAVINGKETEKFKSPFYNFLLFRDVSYPPSMYPLNYRKDRAPRIVLGADKEHKPLILWFEGAAKFGHDPEKDSVGASLSEAAEIARELGMYNGIHLDGGGSAQILVGNSRQLMISDRKKEDHSENERAVPMALYIP